MPRTDGPDPGGVRRELAGRLPAHLLPAAVHALDALPLTLHGKADRAALSAIARAGRTPGAPPRTATEALLVEIWSEVFGFRVGVDEPFAELGGHSLRAMRVLARIAERCGADLSPALLLGGAGGGATIAELAPAVDGADRTPRLELPLEEDEWPPR